MCLVFAVFSGFLTYSGVKNRKKLRGPITDVCTGPHCHCAVDSLWGDNEAVPNAEALIWHNGTFCLSSTLVRSMNFDSSMELWLGHILIHFSWSRAVLLCLIGRQKWSVYCSGV